MRSGQMGDSVIKFVLVSLGALAFISIIVTTYGVFQANSPDVLNNCVMKPVLVSEGNIAITSRDDSLAFLQGRIGSSGGYLFIQNTVDVCNPPNIGYVYNTTNNVSYVVCEDGTFYKYDHVCVEGGKTKSLIEMLFKNKNNASPGQ